MDIKKDKDIDIDIDMLSGSGQRHRPGRLSMAIHVRLVQLLYKKMFYEISSRLNKYWIKLT
jgi:hypothetical protein